MGSASLRKHMNNMAAEESEVSRYMNIAFEQAIEALEAGEVPVGCVVVRKGVVIAKGRNRVNESLNATRHAEIVAVDQLVDLSKNAKTAGSSLSELCSTSVLYVTVEPCIMCAATLRQIGLTRVVFGCSNPRFGGCGSVLDVHREHLSGSCNNPVITEKGVNVTSDPYPPLDLISGVQQDKAVRLLQQFYEGENPATLQLKVDQKETLP